MQRILLLASMFALASLPACFFEPSFSLSGDARTDGPGDGADDGAPVDMVVIPTDAPALLATGRTHACRVMPNTTLRCWGSNAFGEVSATAGEDSGTAVTVFSQLPGFESGWITVAAGYEFTCGLIDQAGTRKVFCWGRNSYGTVNPMSPGSGATPQRQIALADLVPERIYAGEDMACAISAAGAMKCWGNVNFTSPNPTSAGITTINHPTPGKTFTSVAIADTHACAVDNDGVALCWGQNTRRQLGQNDTTFTSNASQLQPISTETARFTSLAAAHEITCGITPQNALACWGSGSHGHIGPGEPTDEPYLLVDDTRTYSRVAVGRTHACALATGSGAGLYCYGSEASGALGSGRFALDFTRTTPVADLGTTVQVVANELYTCALAMDGTNRCWGSNSNGQLGNNEVARKRAKSSIVDFSDVVTGQVTVQSIMAGDYHTCALVGTTSPYEVKCWGDNRDQQSIPASLSETAPKPGNSGVVGEAYSQLATGGYHSCAVRAAGSRISCWGRNGDGQATSQPMPDPDSWSYVAAGSTTTCGIADGVLYCWGTQFDATGSSATTPVAYPGIGTPPSWNWESVSIGSGFLLGAIKDPGSGAYHVGAWGKGCPVGDAVGTMLLTPDERFAGRAFGPAKPRLWAADQNGAHACAHWSFGNTPTTEFVCFGMNDGKQISQTHANCDGTEGISVSLGSFPASTAPDIARVAIGDTHSCAINASGDLMCWGSNNNSVLGPLFLTGASGTPTRLGSPAKYVEVATGFEHTCAVTADRHEVHCWGENRVGQAGDGTQWRPGPVVAGEL